jgi:beta-N-acetylhexosaminidase
MTLGPLMVDVAGKTLTTEDRELLRHPLVGSVILFTRNYENPEQLAGLVAEIRGRARRRCWWRWTTRAGGCSASVPGSR